MSHWSELYPDKGQEARKLLAFARSAGDRTEERRLNPDTHGPLIKEIFEACFTVAVDDRGKPTIAPRTPVEYGEGRPQAREFADYLESIGGRLRGRYRA